MKKNEKKDLKFIVCYLFCSFFFTIVDRDTIGNWHLYVTYLFLLILTPSSHAPSLLSHNSYNKNLKTTKS